MKFDEAAKPEPRPALEALLTKLRGLPPDQVYTHDEIVQLFEMTPFSLKNFQRESVLRAHTVAHGKRLLFGSEKGIANFRKFLRGKTL
jgi:hypothetical protein